MAPSLSDVLLDSDGLNGLFSDRWLIDDTAAEKDDNDRTLLVGLLVEIELYGWIYRIEKQNQFKFFVGYLMIIISTWKGN